MFMAMTSVAVYSSPPASVEPNGELQNGDAGKTELTRGIGKYPGNPNERFAPIMRLDAQASGNMARMRPACTSSNYDYNLTAQLLTDGITATTTPPTLAVNTADGPLPRREREWTLDGGNFTRNVVAGSHNFLQYEWTGMTVQANRVDLVLKVAYKDVKFTNGYSIRLLSRSKNGKRSKDAAWRVVAENKGEGLPGVPTKYKMHSDPNKQTANDYLPARDVRLSLPLPKNCQNFADMRVEFKMDEAVYWTVFNVDFYDGNRRLTTEVLPLSHFASAWMSDGEGEQWAQVDLGRVADFDRVALHWLRRPMQGRVEASDDACQWRTVAQLPNGDRRRDDNIATPGARGRYVRVVMQGGAIDLCPSPMPAVKGYMMSEFEVFGKGLYTSQPCDAPTGDAQRLNLDGGGWRLCRADGMKDGGERISRPGYSAAEGWIDATVPATVLTSYVNIEAVDDPNIADNLFNLSDSYFYSDFWYRRDFRLPHDMRRRRVVLNLDGVNWKADVWLNGRCVDRVEGAFRRGQVDITQWLKTGDDDVNTLAILIHKNDHPGTVKEKNRINTDFNGGILGTDNPTFHASTGWDWISTVRGRNIGLWNDVYLTATDNLLLADPLVTTRLALPDTTATMTPRVVATNVLAREVSGVMRGWIGDLNFEQPVTLKAGEKREIVFEPENFPQLRNRDMRLWWPNGYGEPYLYEAGFEFVPTSQKAKVAETAGGNAKRGVHATIEYKAGIRQMTYADVKTQLKIYVNGCRLVPLGGNWGFPENNLNFRAREYDVAVRLHRDMNFNMIRNWVGMTGDEEFYDACDRYGIMVWQDFWLANPGDGPNPNDEHMFMCNARDFTSRMRRHPSIAIYCGRNEGYPPASLDNQLRQTVAEMNPGLEYISSSADDGVSGHGPYWAEPPRTYFDKQTGKLHSERGMPNIMSPEGLMRTIAPQHLWQQGDAWGRHDFTQAGAQRGASFNAIIERMFGKVTSAEQFARLAQWENYEGYRAMYEADSKYRQGLLIWMSHACWPSLTWQCYDYYFEPTAAFYGARKACEPIHIQWNPLTRNVEVVNRSGGCHRWISASRETLDMQGRVVETRRVKLSTDDDSTAVIASLQTDSVPKGINGTVYFLRLSLNDKNDRLLATNFYVLSTDEGNLQELNSLPEVNLTTQTERHGNSLLVTLKNASPTPAMMVRLNLKANDGDQVLPVDYSDNYFHLMPGEERTITVDWREQDARRQQPFVELTGFNVKQRTLR